MITFYAPSRGPGGTLLLVLRLIPELRKLGVPCKVLDVKDGFLSRELRASAEAGVTLKTIGEDCPWDASLADGEVFVSFNHSYEMLAFYSQRANPRVLIWDVMNGHWRNGVGAYRFPKTRKYFRLHAARKRLAGTLAQHCAVVFMEQDGRNDFEALAGKPLDYNPILPVPIEIPELAAAWAPPAGRTIKVAYIGRPAGWKVNAFKKVALDFKQFPELAFVVITNDAPAFARLLGDTPGVPIEYVEGLWGDGLSAYLRQNIALAFGMGTTCLETSRWGVPTILLDFTYEPEMPEPYGYRWLFQEPGTCLGRELQAGARVSGMTPAQVMADFQARAAEIGAQCREKVRKDFATSAVAEALRQRAAATSLDMAVLRQDSLCRLERFLHRAQCWLHGYDQRLRY